MFWLFPFNSSNSGKSQRSFRETASPAARKLDENPIFPGQRVLDHDLRLNSSRPQLDIRKLWSSDSKEVREHLLRLDSETIACRFRGQVSQKYIETYADKVFGRMVVIYGAYLEGELRGMAELHILPLREKGVDAGRDAELAITVESDFRQHGLGTALMERILAAARNRDVHCVVSYCMPGNDAIRGLVSKFGAAIRLDDGEARGELAPGSPDPFGQFTENVSDAQQLMLRLCAFGSSSSSQDAA